MSIAIIVIIASAVLAIIYGIIAIYSILKLPRGDEKMQSIASAIQAGARAFLNRQYRTVGLVAILFFLLLVYCRV